MSDFTIKNDTESPLKVTSVSKQTPQTESTSFGQMLTDSIDQVRRLQHESGESIQNLVTGKQTNIHQTMIAMEKSSVAFNLLMQIRNKTITAYEKIMRMQVGTAELAKYFDRYRNNKMRLIPICS